MDVLQATFGTGIFQTLQTLGVQSVKIGDTTTDVNNANVGIFIQALEVAFDNAVQVGDDFLVTMNFIGNISQAGYDGFSANFVVNFQITEEVYNIFVDF
jgi:hypothetical protein